MTPEQSFWNSLRPKLPGHVVRIENTVGNGMPDVNVCHNGIEIWLELKAQNDFHIRKEQRVWGLRRALHGGRVFILIHQPRVKLIAIFKHPVETEKVDDKYQDIVSPPTYAVYDHQIEELIEYLFS